MTGDQPSAVLSTSIPPRSPDALSDAHLIARCREGDEPAWVELVDRLAPYVYALVTRGFGLGPGPAQEALQEVFTKAFERLGELQDDAAVRPWVAQIARRLALDHIRGPRLEVELEDGASQDDGPARDALHERLALRDALLELPIEARDLVDRFYLRDQSYKTIAHELGVPLGTVASRLARAMERLRREYAPR